MIKISIVKQGLTKYFEEECARKATGIGQFLAYFIAPSIPNIINDKLDEIKNTGILNDIIKDNSIDLDATIIRAKNAMDKCGSIEVMGFRLNTSDIDRIAEYIRNIQC